MRNTWKQLPIVSRRLDFVSGEAHAQQPTSLHSLNRWRINGGASVSLHRRAPWCESPQHSLMAPNEMSIAQATRLTHPYCTPGVPRWVIGPTPGDNNGWGFCESAAMVPTDDLPNWILWDGNSWHSGCDLNFVVPHRQTYGSMRPGKAGNSVLCVIS